jgi:phenylacetate-CoA ligase
MTGIPNWLAKAYLGLRHRFGDKMYQQAAQELELHQWLSPQEIRELQWRKLSALVTRAYQNVPYYRERFDEYGLRPKDIQCPADFARVPLLTKKDIQENLGTMTARDMSQTELLMNHTGGSTGHPLSFYQDRDYLRYASAGRTWGFQLCGFELGDKQAFFWGSDYDSTAHKGWRNRLRDWSQNALWINVFDLTEDALYRAARSLSRWRPDFIWGYTSSVEMLAKTVEQHGVEGIHPRAVQLTAEVVAEEQRSLIEDTFGCRVFNRYGCREASLVAHECPAHSGLHVLADNNYVEFVQDGRPVTPGQEGMIVVTNLNNHGMPLLRYVVGDTGVPAQRVCECGRGYPLMDAVKGRVVDIIVSPSGKLLHGEFFTHLFYKTQGVRQFQVIQETEQDLSIKIVPGEGFSRETFCFLEQALHEYGDDRFVPHFETCDHIPLSASGKYRFVISRIPK